MLHTQCYSILRAYTAIISDILQYIAHTILLTSEKVCNIIIAQSNFPNIGEILKHYPTHICKHNAVANMK